MPVQTFAGNVFQVYYTRLRKASDVRLAHVSEIISSIRLVKFEAWEEGLGVKMGALREAELKQLWAKSVTTIFDNLLMSGVPILVSVSVSVLWCDVSTSLMLAVQVTTFVCHTKGYLHS